MTYERDIFYNIEKISFSKRKKLLNDAFKLSSKWNVDKLDCSISWSRQEIEMSFEDIMKKFDAGCHFVVIYRRGFILDEYIGEIGFSTGWGISYFLWIYLEFEKLNELVDKYKLEVKE